MLQAVAAVATFGAGGAMTTLLAAMLIATSVGAVHAGTGSGPLLGGLDAIEVLAPDGAREIRTPEGFMRIEPGQPGDGGGVGSFAVVRLDETAQMDAPSAPSVPDVRAGSGPAVARRGIASERGGLVDRAAPAAGPDPCREQRSRYARRLLQGAGIDVEDPMALFQGLAAPGMSSGDLLYGGYFLSGIDPIRPLAWDMELRSIARDLAGCESRAAAAP